MAIEGYSKNIRDLIMGDNMSFHIPIYQRSYTWLAKQQVHKLLADILEFAREYQQNTNGEYYIGNVILKNQDRGFVTERIVIDGQQRITTTILMLCVLRDIYLQDSNNEDELRSARTIGKALYSDDGDSIRIKLNNMEHQKTLNLLLSGAVDAIDATDKSTTYWKNYQHIHQVLGKLRSDNDWRLQQFPDILNRVKVVAIFLDKEQDENSVFESINSAGMPLSGPDLIKNFIFTFKHYSVSHQQEDQLVALYTEKFESLFSGHQQPLEEIEAFFREYIAVKTGDKVNKDPKVVYYAYKHWVGAIASLDHCRMLILDLVKWGVIYNTLRMGSHPDLNPNNLGFLRGSFLSYATLLMDMIDKLAKVEEGHVVVYDKEHLNSAIARVVAYDVSRFLAGRGLKTITRFVPTIPKLLEKADPNYFHDYANALTDLVVSAQQDYKQPSVATIRQSVNALDLYTNKKQLLRFFVLLENAGQKEQISFDHGLKGCQVEHIMPQTLGPGWQNITEQEHQRYLHKLGNLSITFDNAALGNLGFPEKKLKLAQLSRVRLNQMLLDYDCFGPEQIRDRATKLLDRFFNAYHLSDGGELPDDPPGAQGNLSPQQWLDKVRSQTGAPEIAGLKFANTWTAICEHLDISVGHDSAHRRLERWRSMNKPVWPSTGLT